MAYLGTIRRGMEIGALAQDADGHFLQVNGDMRQTLNKSRMEATLRKANLCIHALAPTTRQPTPLERAAVVIVIKPRRRAVFPIEVPAATPA